jgi:hypothetical protein
MYRTLDTSFWTDPKIGALCPLGKLLSLYLITSPHGHIGGIYYLPDEIITLETGLSPKILDTLWHTLSGSGFSRRDRKLSVVWVVRMFFYQARGEKNERSVAGYLPTLHNSHLVNEFLMVYPSVKRWIKDRVSIGYPEFGKSGPLDQDQDQEDIYGAHTTSEKKKTTRRFTPPTLEEVTAYCLERKNGINPQGFLDSNQQKGWVVGKNRTPMKDWRAAIRTWERVTLDSDRLFSAPQKDGPIESEIKYAR